MTIIVLKEPLLKCLTNVQEFKNTFYKLTEYTNLCFKTTAMRDHLSYKTPLAGTWTYISIDIFLPVIKDHLSYKTTFCGHVRQS